MTTQLQGTRVAILTTLGFEEVELTHPQTALREAGAEVSVVAPKGPTVRAWKDTDWSIDVPVDELLDASDPAKFDALVLPGGVINPDKLRLEPKAVRFVQHFFEKNKPVFAICHGTQTLIEADVVRDRTLTSWPSLKKDLQNAGAEWIDKSAVVDGNLVTSRKPDDLPDFLKAAIQLLESHRAAASNRAA